MKKIFFMLIASATITACGQQQSSGAFSVSGKIVHVTAQKVLLQQIPFNGTAPVVVDSATLSSDGSYNLKSTAKEQSLYLVGVPNGPQAIFINDNNNIKINLDANNFKDPDIENSDATKNLYQFIDGYLQKDSVARVTFQQMDSLHQQNAGDSAMQLLQTQGENQVTALNEYIKNFVNTAKSPAAIHFAIAQALRTHSMPDSAILALANTASNRFKDHSGLATLKATLTTELAQQAQQPGYPLLNQPAPNLTMNDVNGKPVSINNFKGKYLLVDFWASWCGPCRQENPNVVAAYNKFKDKNFAILGVSLDEDKSSWIDAIKKDKLSWTQMSDLKQWESAAVNTYQFSGIPFNVLIDPQGKIIASSLRGPDLDNKLAEVLK
ncbi:MAG: redoxin domain-containing protein [Chitinophagaceae bacterium]